MKNKDIDFKGIKQYYVPVIEEAKKKDVLLSLFSKLQFKKAIIYSDDKMRLKEIEKIMTQQYFVFASMHNEMD